MLVSKTGSMESFAHDDPGVGLLIADDSLAIVAASPRFLREFACTLADLEGVEFGELIASSDRRASLALDRALSQASTTRLDLCAQLVIGRRSRLTRLLVERRSAAGWQILVECIEGPDNLVFELLADQRRWLSLLASSSDAVVVLDAQQRVSVHNAHVIELLELRSEHGVLVGEEALRGRELVELAQGEGLGELRALLTTLPERKSEPLRAAITLHERQVEVEVRPLALPGRGHGGHVISLRDVSDRHRAQVERERAEAERVARAREQLRHHEAVIEAQRAAIRALAAPRIPVSKHLTVVPFVGDITRERMAEISHELLDALSRAGARVVILDITGVPNLDAGAVEGLVSLGRALRMIGVRSLLTGVSPTTAQRLASADFSARELEVRASLEEAIAAFGSHAALVRKR